MANNNTKHRSRDSVNLKNLRDEIASIDHEIVELIAQRTYVAEAIADAKNEAGLPTTDREQEERVMKRARENAEQFDVDPDIVQEVFLLLIELNKVEQRNNR